MKTSEEILYLLRKDLEEILEEDTTLRQDLLIHRSILLIEYYFQWHESKEQE